MGYSLQQLVADVRKALKSSPMPEAGNTIRALVEHALADENFRRENFGPDKTDKRTIIHEDPELDFCVCVHVYEGAAHTGPHDHGESWAVYGQAEGTTEMTDWRILTPGTEEAPARVEPVKSYEMSPGMAHFYPVGAIHSPSRQDSTKLLRVEGKNLDHVKRTPMEPVASAAA